jgi:citrate lyase beta subunit
LSGLRRLALPKAPRDRDTTRPVHVVYGGAHLFQAASAAKIGARARAAMETWGADDHAFGRAVGVTDPTLAPLVAARVRDKLARRPVEAICIDFEDGYGPRSDDEEDAEARRAARELARAPLDGVVIGIRIKSLAAPTMKRAVRTLDVFLTAMIGALGTGALRPGFSVTLPKVERAEEVTALADLLDALESKLGLARGSVAVELMTETPRALVDERGQIALPRLVEASRGRAVCVHLGAYDLTAELGVTAVDQRLDHPFCDLARLLMRLSASVAVSDGATTLLPLAPAEGSPDEKASAVHRAWKLHARNVARAIDVGIWQGWDLHPAQLPARYGALFAHFLGHRAELGARLRSFVEHATTASRVGQVFDDAATGQGLVSFFLRGLACGALDEDDLRATTLGKAELETAASSTFAARP